MVRGGFATGKAAAAIPPAEDERLRAQQLGIKATRRAIFESWLTPEGLAELEVLLETGAYNVGFPEHAVLLSVAALLRHGANDSVRDQWPSTAARHGISSGSTPKAGAAAVMNIGYYGHVMYVESVNGDGTITVSDYNFAWDGLYRNYTRSASGLTYIYF